MVFVLLPTSGEIKSINAVLQRRAPFGNTSHSVMVISGCLFNLISPQTSPSLPKYRFCDSTICQLIKLIFFYCLWVQYLRPCPCVWTVVLHIKWVVSILISSSWNRVCDLNSLCVPAGTEAFRSLVLQGKRPAASACPPLSVRISTVQHREQFWSSWPRWITGTSSGKW